MLEVLHILQMVKGAAWGNIKVPALSCWGVTWIGEEDNGGDGRIHISDVLICNGFSLISLPALHLRFGMLGLAISNICGIYFT